MLYFTLGLARIFVLSLVVLASAIAFFHYWQLMKLLNDQSKLLNDKDKLLNDQSKLLNDQSMLLTDRYELLKDVHELLKDHNTFLHDHNKSLNELYELLKDQSRLLNDKEKLLNDQDKLLNDPDFHKHQAMAAFNDAEKWRSEAVNVLYKNVSDSELDNATRWIQYAEPFAEARSCLPIWKNWTSHVAVSSLMSELDELNSGITQWTDVDRKSLLALHSYHTTGIEGNTLTLSETALVIEDKPLVAGFQEDGLLTPVSQRSLIEVKNMRYILDVLDFDMPPALTKVTVNITQQALVGINAAIIRDEDKPFGFRTHAVAVGHQKIILPMPDEVPRLVTLYVDWLNAALKELRSLSVEEHKEERFVQALSLACDAHTRFVHIHPFSDGNGRLARILSGLVLREVGLPLPLFLKEKRHEYIKAVGAGTIGKDYTPICQLHFEAVRRTVKIMPQLKLTRMTE